MYNKEFLLVFHYKQNGWHTTEVLRYEDKQQAKDDLFLAANYVLDAGDVDSEKAWEKIKEFHRDVNPLENTRCKFSVESKRELFQAELVPYNDVADWLHIEHMNIIHKDGKGNNFANEYTADDKYAKIRFREIVEEDIAKKDKQTAMLQRITLDEYMQEGKYAWCVEENGEMKSLKMKDYKIKDIRFDKTKYLDGQNKSVFLGILEAYRRGERYFMTPAEKRWATEEEKKIANLTPDFKEGKIQTLKK